MSHDVFGERAVESSITIERTLRKNYTCMYALAWRTVSYMYGLISLEWVV